MCKTEADLQTQQMNYGCSNGEGQIRGIESTDTNYCIRNTLATKIYCIAQEVIAIIL